MLFLLSLVIRTVARVLIGVGAQMTGRRTSRSSCCAISSGSFAARPAARGCGHSIARGTVAFDRSPGLAKPSARAGIRWRSAVTEPLSPPM
jgi:hypothetical protein